MINGKRKMKWFLFFILALGTSAVAFAGEPEAKIDSGDTAWMLISAALVLLMIPGLAFFYGGMVRSKNVLNILILSFIALGVTTI